MEGEFFLKNNKGADQNRAVLGGFFFKINKHAGQIPIHVQGEFFAQKQ